MRIFTVGIMTAAVLLISIPAFCAGVFVFEDFDDGTYDTNWWTITKNDEQSSVWFDSGSCVLSNGAALSLRMDQWEPPVELLAIMVLDGDVSLTIASNCWGHFMKSTQGTYCLFEGGWFGPSPWCLGPSYEFRLFYDGNLLRLDAGGVMVFWNTNWPSVNGRSIRFGSSVYAKLDFLSVNFSLPSLTITRSQDEVILTWPLYATGFTLQSASDPALPESWVPVFTPPVIVNGSNTVTEPISGLPQFYRLVR